MKTTFLYFPGMFENPGSDFSGHGKYKMFFFKARKMFRNHD